jgi:type IV pilus assembly protein PilN
MIRINLLGQVPRRPKARRRIRAVPLEATIQLLMLIGAVVLGFGALAWQYTALRSSIEQTEKRITVLRAEKQRMDQLKQEIAAYEQQQAILQQRIAVIEELQRNRVGGQELLQALANTVNRTETLWLTNLTRQGNSLTIEGTAGSVNAVANFITQLKRSGYFGKVEIKEAKQNEKNPALPTFNFSLTAEFALPQAQPAAAPAGPKKG